MINTKKARTIAACLLIAIIIPVFIGCSHTPIGENADEGLYINGKHVDMLMPDSGSYFYDQLSDEEKNIYTASLVALEMGASEYELAAVDCDEYGAACKRAIDALLRDHPEFFWIDGGYQIRTTKVSGQNGGILQVELNTHAYWKDRDLSAARNEFEEAVSEIIALASELDDPYEKVKLVNDWLAENVEYDEKSLLDPSSTTDAEDAFINTVYGTLIARKTLCGGYAYTFSYIMNRLGIETLCITGTTVDGLHAWNAVKLGGEYYYIDTTWADDNQNGNVLYSYFCLNREEMSRTHTADDLFVYPEATATEYNYFLREGLYLETYSFNKYSALFSEYSSGNTFSVKFPNEVVLNAAVRDLIENSKFYKLSGMKDTDKFSYTIDEVHYILTLYH